MKTKYDTHPLKKGDRVKVMNCRFDGTPFCEGEATIVSNADTDHRYLVRFRNGDVVERFCEEHRKL